MKKTWKNPSFEELNIKETAGGTKYTPEFDGDAWQKEDGTWHQPIGGSLSGKK